ncbi:PTS transporter subunit EIIB, partial [Caulobacter radicis]
ALGARGIVRPSDKALQVVLGPIADTVAGEIRAAVGAGGQAAVSAPAAAPAKAAVDAKTAKALLPGLGGKANILAVSACSSRLRLELADPSKLDEAALKAAGVRALVRLDGPVVHLVIGPNAEVVCAALAKSVAR